MFFTLILWFFFIYASNVFITFLLRFLSIFWFRIPTQRFLGRIQVRWDQQVSTITLSEKNAVNTMGESNIPMHALIFWCGWETNIIHTIFSYLFTLLANNMRCGKTLAHWLFKHLNEIYGGTPPSLDDIKTEPESVKLFINALFLHRTHISHITKFKSILAATFMRFRWSFLKVIGNEPSGKYKDPTHHHFHHTIMSILSDTKISKFVA